MLNRIKQYDWKQLNVSLLIIVFLLCSISMLAVRLAGGDDKGLGYMRGQLFGICLGILIIALLSMIDYHFICQFVGLYYIFGVALTLATKTPLGTNNGTDAVRWIKIGSITFQPAELMKIIFILTIATFLSKRKAKLDRITTLIMVAILSMVPMIIILKQPDLSSSLVVVFIMIVMVLAGGVSYQILSPIFIAAIPIIGVGAWYIQQPNNFILRDYQYNRIMAWLYPKTMDPGNKWNYQQNYSIRSIASGQIYGKFLQDGGKGNASRVYNGVGVRESDFIWSVIGEEFGFLGCCIILLLFAFLIFKCFIVAKKAQDYLGKMIALGVAAMYMFQVFANISVATFIFPNTGLPLPFMSNGLSSLVSSMIGIGLIINIGIQPAKSSKGGFSMRNMYGSDSGRNIESDLEL